MSVDEERALRTMLEAREARALSERRTKAKWVGRGLWALGIVILLALLGPAPNRRLLVDAIRELNAPPEEETVPASAPDLLESLKGREGVESGDVEFARQFMDFLGSGKTRISEPSD